MERPDKKRSRKSDDCGDHKFEGMLERDPKILDSNLTMIYETATARNLFSG